MASPTVPKVPISALPLPLKSHILTQNLTCDPRTPASGFSASDSGSKKTLVDVLTDTPSIMRRARIVAPQTHFSHLTPLNLPFPYRIEPPPEGVEINDQAEWVELWLSLREPTEERPTVASLRTEPGLKKYSRQSRDDTTRHLLSLSDTTLRDCLPHLDIGDAFEIIGTPSLSKSDSAGEAGPTGSKNEAAGTAARQELVDVLTGHSVLMNLDGGESIPYAPWSLRYGGHQFGSWAGQLGDGRAISILETPHPSDPDLSYELQLKGAGRTPYSRTADGLAVLRSSIREYLCSEAMFALGIPTTRGLALIHLPDLPVSRETVETACVLTRVAPSFLRIGSFEALNPPQNVFFLSFGMVTGTGTGTPGGDRDLEAMRILGEWVVRRVLKLDFGSKALQDVKVKWGKELVLECARRNAEMVAKWQVYGFMHGVINTDNVSIMGLTIDYGPYAFMDIYHENHICNHSDEEGRYSYKFQPTMIQFAVRQLLTALSPLIGAEAELGHAVPAGWASLSDSAGGKEKEELKEKIEKWSKKGMEIEDEVLGVLTEGVQRGWEAGFRRRLGLQKTVSTDADALIHPLLSLMQTHKLDFHSTFRALCSFRPPPNSPTSQREEPRAPASATETGSGTRRGSGAEKDGRDAFIAQLAKNAHEAPASEAAFRGEWTSWLEKYGARLNEEIEEGLWSSSSHSTTNGINGANGHSHAGSQSDEAWASRERAMRKANPRFILRQWVLEETIKRVQDDPGTGKRALAKVHQMATNPFDPWGGELDGRTDDELSEEEREERRFCGLGAKRFVGFQCSCSS